MVREWKAERLHCLAVAIQLGIDDFLVPLTFAVMQVYVRFRQGSGVRRMKQEAAGEVARRAVGNKPNFGAGDV